MFNEIKKIRQPKNVLKKEDFKINFQTDFQELMYLHSLGRKSDCYDCKIMTDEMYENALGREEEFVEEVVEHNEEKLFHVFRAYKNYQEEDTIVPQSRILCFIF